MFFLKKIHSRSILCLCVILLIVFVPLWFFKIFTSTLTPVLTSTPIPISNPNPTLPLAQKSLAPKSSRKERTSEDVERFNKRIAEYNRQIDPNLGQNGEASFLKLQDKLLGENALKLDGINTALSHKISFERTLKDVRHSLCKNMTYNNSLPSASVIVIFHNEPWSLLLRTIYSILNRTPEHFLKEILLVDDCSSNENLGDFFSYYLEYFLVERKIHLIRLPERNGLIRARLAGAEKATGEVLIFLDAHIETTFGWIEPLLARIKEKRTTVVVPIIDEISRTTFEYPYEKDYPHFFIYGFSWLGWFMTMENPKSYLKDFNPIAPCDTPTMPGGLFGIDRKYFWEIGSYDRGMEGWGGENLEMSFRIWQCGGEIEIIPCSRVGHVYRAFRPYKIPGNKNTFMYNTARFAHVWMDDYKKVFFLHFHTYENVSSVGSITERLELRERLKCKSFDWYLKNVYPEKFAIGDNVEHYGRLMLKAKKVCLDNYGSVQNAYVLSVFTCIPRQSYSQLFTLTKTGELRTEFNCANAVPVAGKNQTFQIKMLPCNNESEKWTINNEGQVIHARTKLCLGINNLVSGQGTSLLKCSKENNQLWTFSSADLTNP